MNKQPVSRTLVAALSVFALVIGGCSSLPRDSEPAALRSFTPSESGGDDQGPTPDQEPDLLLRDFFSASARPKLDYQAARDYLAPGLAEQWDPKDDMVVVDRIDINTQAGASDEERTFDVRGNVLGRLDRDGAYNPDDGRYEASVTLRRQDDGQWRITGLPTGAVFERAELRNCFEPNRLFFFDPSGEVLVGDRRWVHESDQAIDSALINLLIRGPSQRLGPGVRFEWPEGAEYVGSDEGTYQFSGLDVLSTEMRIAFAAQLVWTLAEANVPGPYRFETDGVPLAEGYTTLSTDDFPALNPELAASAVSPFYALADGNVLKVSAAGAQPVDGELGEFHDVASADIDGEDFAAVVRRRGDRQELWAGGADAPWNLALTGETLTRPSVEDNSTGVWSVVDGRRVVRLERPATSGEAAATEVKSRELEELDGDISVLRLSQTGVRVALIIDGQVYLGIVAVDEHDERSIVNLTELGSQQLKGTAVALDWQTDGSLIVGTSSADSPLWRVEQDGSSVAALPSGNVTAPVVAVASGATMMYLTDAIAIRQLPTNATTDTSFWREVPGLQGVRSAPVIAH